MHAFVLKAKPPRRPSAPGHRTPAATIARLAAGLREALVEDLSPESWHAVIAAISRGELWIVENIMLGTAEESLAPAWADRFVAALGGTYTESANAELARVGVRMRVELYQKALEKAAKKPKRSKNRFPGVPHSDEFIRQHAADLVVRVSREQRQAIREQIAARYNNERRPETLVRDLRNVVGLDPRRARALRTFEDKLRENGARSVSEQVERYRNTLLQNRAETIARTESVAVENQARMEAWDIALDAGELPHDAEQEWVSTGDACPLCDELDGMRVPVGEAFPSSHGPALPPLHPNCYCVITLRSF